MSTTSEVKTPNYQPDDDLVPVPAQIVLAIMCRKYEPLEPEYKEWCGDITGIIMRPLPSSVKDAWVTDLREKAAILKEVADYVQRAPVAKEREPEYEVDGSLFDMAVAQ